MTKSATSRRSSIMLAGMAGAVLLVVWMPLGGWSDIALAGSALLVSSFIANRVFRQSATTAEKIADLRDRVDSPPS